MRLQEEKIDKILNFMIEADGLKEIKRAGWVREGVKDPEHVADHVFSVALMSYVMATEMGLNAERCAAMALIEDIAEAKIGDIAVRPREKDQTASNAEKKRLEQTGTEEMLSLLGEMPASRLGALWKELKTESTEEAKLVKQLDKLDYIVQLVRYSEDLNDKAVDEFFETAGRVITIPEVRYAYESVRKRLARLRKK